MNFDAPETTEGGGGFLNDPGQYHVVINEVLEGESSKGTPINGITITVEVLAGTVEGQQGKTKQESLFLPSQKDIAKEESEGHPCMARKKFGALLIATNLMQPDQLGKPINFEPSHMVGRQCVIKFSKQMERDGKGDFTIESNFLQISYSDIHHVDDPGVEAVPKNADALSMITKEHRHAKEWFAYKGKPKSHRESVAKNNAERRPMVASSVADDLF